MTVRIVIEAETATEALEQARELGSVQSVTASVSIAEKTVPVQRDEMPPGGYDTPDNPLAAAIEALPAPSPSTPEPPPEPPTAAAELDARGIPWDARVHAGNKAISKTTGNWKKRRRVDPAELARVEAELQGATPPPVTSGATPPPPAVPTAGAAPPPPPAEAPGTEPPPATFQELMRLAKERDVDIAVLNAHVVAVSGGTVQQIALAHDKPAYIQAVYDRIVSNG
jgi:hypothetical protein